MPSFIPQAGLFSAVLTAFIVEAYRLLQRDSSQDSVQILLQISQQLAGLSVNPGFTNSTLSPADLPSFDPDTNLVWTNALWFCALILSIISASLGMLVKHDVRVERHRHGIC